MLSEINGCIIIPTYNNEQTLKDVLERTIMIVPSSKIIVVNDGSSDGTSDILKQFEDKINVITNAKNEGKGFSLARGFKKATNLGFSNAITLDSDGQHFPEDIPLLVEEAIKNPNAVIMGSRDMNQSGVPGKSSFGNKFSNFWFKLETWISLPDTQTGFRLYPLIPISKMRFYTTKFEFEIEVIVRLAWNNVKFIPVPIRVKYDLTERVSHFRPGRDFFRISVLNSVLVICALFYFYPKKVLSFDTLRRIKEEAIKPKESNFRKALSIGFGFFMGIVPIWGFQLLIGIPLAVLFRMNKVLFIASANISIPPMIPFIIYSSLLMGQLIIGGETNQAEIFSFSMDSIQNNVVQYFFGAIVLAVLAFFSSFVISFSLLKIFRKEPGFTVE